MITRILVCPFDRELLARFDNQALVVTVDNVDAIHQANNAMSGTRNKIRVIRVTPGCSLGEISFKDDWKKIPLAFYVEELGAWPMVARQLGLMRALNIRVYLPACPRENLTAARMLSSLGISCALHFNGASPDWDLMADLATYALLGRVKHGAIDPFDCLAEEYQPNQRTSFQAVYFNDPRKYLHVNRAGAAALTAEDLAANRFLVDRFEDVTDLDQHPMYQNSAARWQESLLHFDDCACCPGWRICMGFFDAMDPSHEKCRAFCTELMDVVEQYRAKKATEEEPWRP